MDFRKLNLDVKKLNLDFLNLNKKELYQSIILYTTTLFITIGMVYLLFPNLLTGLSEVKKVNNNIVVIDEKVDSIKSQQDAILERVNTLYDIQFELHFNTMDSLRLLDKKIDGVRISTQQSNRILDQHTRDLQYLKQLGLDRYVNKDKNTSSLEGLFRKN